MKKNISGYELGRIVGFMKTVAVYFAYICSLPRNPKIQLLPCIILLYSPTWLFLVQVEINTLVVRFCLWNQTINSWLSCINCISRLNLPNKRSYRFTIMKTSTCKDGIAKQQPNKVGTTRLDHLYILCHFFNHTSWCLLQNVAIMMFISSVCFNLKVLSGSYKPTTYQRVGRLSM